MAKMIALPGDGRLERVGGTWGRPQDSASPGDLRRAQEAHRQVERIQDATQRGLSIGEGIGFEKGEAAGIVKGERSRLDDEISRLEQIARGELDIHDALVLLEAERDAEPESQLVGSSAEEQPPAQPETSEYDIPKFAGDRALASLEFVDGSQLVS
jgi:hypothetical protein